MKKQNNEKDKGPRNYSVGEFAERSGLSLRFVRRLVAERKIEHMRFGRRIAISEAEMLRFFQQHTVRCEGQEDG